MADLQFHDLANLFPLMEGQAFLDLVDDIADHGIREPVWLFEGKILDGRNRYRAAHEVGEEVPTREYSGDDPVGFVVSLNLKRRHLNESQRAMVAAKIANLEHGQHREAQICASTQRDAAEQLSVSRRAVQTAKKVQDHGTPDLVAAVETGTVAVSTAADIATLPEAEQTEVVAQGEKEILQKAKEIRAAKTEKRRAERVEKIAEISKASVEMDPEGVGQFPVLLADPPWRYEFAETDSREIENQYPTMTVEDICAMRVSEAALEDAVLFLWTTSPKLREGLQVMEAWGFSYKTCAVWDKQVIGMGYYFRQQHELLLIGARGSVPAPEPNARASSVVCSPREKHSRKPDLFYELIEGMYPGLPKLELFSRKAREGWQSWGNQSATFASA